MRSLFSSLYHVFDDTPHTVKNHVTLANVSFYPLVKENKLHSSCQCFTLFIAINTKRALQMAVFAVSQGDYNLHEIMQLHVTVTAPRKLDGWSLEIRIYVAA